ncbi:MAG TPA: TatD family hydrolase [bacterium]|nr:TatD family hydrolase [bacterium]HPP86241.1 TatD family hydrolase [bacterium]
MIDIHCHLYKEYYENLDEIIPQNFEALINTADSIEKFDECRAIAEKYKNVYFAVGIHPHNASKEKNEFQKIADYICHNKCLAVGEIGLDFYYDYSDKKDQIELFERQIEIAEAGNKNIIVHSRSAENEVYEIIKSLQKINVLLHCYTGPKNVLEKICAHRNFFVSIGGMITFKNNQQFIEYLDILPLEKLLIETDAPYLAPAPQRGKQNIPEYIKYTYQKISELKKIDFDELEKIISDNFHKIASA